jgi:hypothetical protein
MFIDYSGIHGARAYCDGAPDRALQDIANYAAGAMGLGLSADEMINDIAWHWLLPEDDIDVVTAGDELHVIINATITGETM